MNHGVRPLFSHGHDRFGAKVNPAGGAGAIGAVVVAREGTRPARRSGGLVSAVELPGRSVSPEVFELIELPG